MNSKELNNSFIKRKKSFYSFIENIKLKSKADLFTVINPTLICNPYISDFPKKYFLNNAKKENKIILFMKHLLIFYSKMFIKLFIYLLKYIIFKLTYIKKANISKNMIFFDIFFLIENIVKDNKFNENYFVGVYEVLDKNNVNYAFLPRLYDKSLSLFNFIKFLKIINQDKRYFIFEYEYLTIKDFFKIFVKIIIYPFTIFRFYQKENSNANIIFNNEIFKDISKVSFETFSRYYFGKNIAKKLKDIKIYSWCEFQITERSFNYGIRTSNSKIKLIGLQFFLNYETYFNIRVDDLDYELLSSPHQVLVNGKYFILDRKKVKYENGVSLRYSEVFHFQGLQEEKNVLLIGSYNELDTKYMLESAKGLNNTIFKNHPILDIKKLGNLLNNIIISDKNIYELFKDSKLVIATSASGTPLESVACGVSVIIIASKNNLTANPLVNYGRGKIWDIAFSKNDVKLLYNKLLNYRQNNIGEIKKISLWYKKNFFIEPTEKNIINVFELDK